MDQKHINGGVDDELVSFFLVFDNNTLPKFDGLLTTLHDMTHSPFRRLGDAFMFS